MSQAQAALKGKVALVTGSTSGIGLGIARELAKVGVDILLNGRSERPRDGKLLQSFEPYGVRHCYFGADMRDRRQIELLTQYAESHLGPVDILVNNAGVQHVSPATLFSIEKWDEIIALNLSAAFHTTQICLPSMCQRRHGRIINISSVHGLVASVNKSAYCAAKHGLIGLTKAIALEHATAGVTCNAVCPGFVHTPLVQAQVQALADTEFNGDTAKAKAEMLREKQPSQAFVTAEQIGAAVVYLASHAAGQVTGTTITVDGGWTAC
ncbi:short chain dehydrogenase KR domain [Trypanosoma vivax]|uniref:3-oxoacyl-[acyl-carrier-protein] reductase n=1 Tax=Trypanosoma vivax (strain Y486) TaxID=1055687 RepID=G0U8A3_TRYVY|nr:putative NAD or NADP dependent oxidoreductase [Trypanosoma vivax]KAH8607051.1 short chain dehydrogenase KR domain [Trypanosoma vivax]CCC52113.1 putative NAD or NADP dependent oxidoreductase [Trypanosoma vivax Y486]